MFKPNYRIRLYIGRNLMANAIVIAADDETTVYTETRGGQPVKDATIDLCLLMAQSCMQPGTQRDAIERLLAERGQGVPMAGPASAGRHAKAQSNLEDDIPF